MEEKSFKKDKKKTPLFLLFLLFFIIVVLFIIYKMILYFEPIGIIEYNGYAISGKELIDNLLKSDLNGKKYIEPLIVNEDSKLYKKLSTFFIGELRKTKINLDYPVYIKNNSTLLNLSDESKLITTDYEEIDAYKNSAIEDGNLYNLSDYNRADLNDYLLMKNSDNIFISCKDIAIKTTTHKYCIPKNSIINFREKYITYYHLENDKFKYETIIDVEEYSEVDIKIVNYNIDFDNGNYEAIEKDDICTYKEFLIRLGVIQEKKDNNKIEEETDTENDKEKDDKNKKDKVKNNDNGSSKSIETDLSQNERTIGNW